MGGADEERDIGNQRASAAGETREDEHDHGTRGTDEEADADDEESLRRLDDWLTKEQDRIANEWERVNDAARIGKPTHRSALPARKAAILDHAELEMPLVQAIEEALAFVEKHSSHGAAIGPVRRKDRWSLPPAAGREAIVNAVAYAELGR